MQSLDSLQRAAKALQPQLVAWRRDFHMHPELGFEEVRTAGIVADHLRGLGLEVSTGVGKTGVVALIEPDCVSENAPTVMLRFDMDALPICEANNVSYRSSVDGIMHACGHDGHTAIGMGVAQVLTSCRNDLAGRVKLVFQPAEEGLGGALAMIADGALEGPRPAAAFGLHLWSRIPLDEIIVQEGPLMAGADKIQLVVNGVGGHGAMPHETVDAVVVASEIVLAWQTIVSRTVDPTVPAGLADLLASKDPAQARQVTSGLACARSTPTNLSLSLTPDPSPSPLPSCSFFSPSSSPLYLSSFVS